MLVARLGAMADFIVINVSSPNTPGLRDWQRSARLAPLMRPILAEAIKLTPSQARAGEAFASSDCAGAGLGMRGGLHPNGVDGLVACNTTTAREAVGVRT